MGTLCFAVQSIWWVSAHERRGDDDDDFRYISFSPEPDFCNGKEAYQEYLSLPLKTGSWAFPTQHEFESSASMHEKIDHREEMYTRAFIDANGLSVYDSSFIVTSDLDGDDFAQQGYKMHYQPPPRNFAFIAKRIIEMLRERLPNLQFKYVKPVHVRDTFTITDYDVPENLFGKFFTFWTTEHLCEITRAIRQAIEEADRYAAERRRSPLHIISRAVQDVASAGAAGVSDLIARALFEGGRRAGIYDQDAVYEAPTPPRQLEHGLAPPYDCTIEGAPEGLSIRYGINKQTTWPWTENRFYVLRSRTAVMRADTDTEQDYRPESISSIDALLKRKCACRPDFVVWGPDTKSHERLQVHCPVPWRTPRFFV